MFEIIFDSHRDDFTTKDFEECYRSNNTKLEEIVGSNRFCFTKNIEVDLRQILNGKDFQDLDQLTETFSDPFIHSYGHFRFLIAVEQDSNIARFCKKNNPLAEWGAVFGTIGFVYGPMTDELILHETLHIFGADDCYMSNDEGFNDSICGHTNCIMQYNPNNATLQAQQWICKPNILKIRNFLKSCQ